jgi:hypothetical protein
MVDKKPLADLGAGVYFDACKKSGDLAKHARYKKQAYLVKEMRHPVSYQSMQPRIKHEYFEETLGSGILGACCLNFSIKEYRNNQHLQNN